MNTNNKDHAGLADEFNKDEPRVNWHDETLWWVRQKRDKAAARVPDWEVLRDTASRIKDNVLSRLSEYLQQFEAAATANGIVIHWAADAAEHNEIILSLLRQHGADQMVKSKSMLTEECGLNEFLEEKGVGVVDTDLGERVVQLAGEPPSHIVLPWIHK
jgi:L-lactate dehydrogenase complex protein LldF